MFRSSVVRVESASNELAGGGALLPLLLASACANPKPLPDLGEEPMRRLCCESNGARAADPDSSPANRHAQKTQTLWDEDA